LPRGLVDRRGAGRVDGGRGDRPGLPVPVHLGLSTAVFATVSLVALRFRLPGPDGTEESGSAAGAASPASRRRARPPGTRAGAALGGRLSRGRSWSPPVRRAR